MTANESLNAESRKAKNQVINKAVSGLTLDDAERKFLTFLIDAKEYRQ